MLGRENHRLQEHIETVGIYNSQHKCTGKVGGEHDYVEMDDDRQTIYV